MYRKREQMVPFTGTKYLICYPLLLAFLTLIIIPVISLGALFIASQGASGQNITLATTAVMILNFTLSLLVLQKLGKISPVGLGFERAGMGNGIALGAGGGFLAISVVAVIIWAVGAVKLQGNWGSGNLSYLLIGVVFFCFQGTFEELIFRGYLMPHFSKAKGPIFSLILTSLLFTLAHGLNPGIGLIPLVNLFLAGAVFGLIYCTSGSMWVAGFAHAAWNFAQGYIYGAQVSGLSLPGSVLVAKPLPGKELLSGGSFGFEGSLVTTFIGILLLIGLGWLAKKQSVKEK